MMFTFLRDLRSHMRTDGNDRFRSALVRLIASFVIAGNVQLQAQPATGESNVARPAMPAERVVPGFPADSNASSARALLVSQLMTNREAMIGIITRQIESLEDELKQPGIR